MILSQAGLRTLHEAGPELKRAISGNLEELLDDNPEPMHRVLLRVIHTRSRESVFNFAISFAEEPFSLRQRLVEHEEGTPQLQQGEVAESQLYDQGRYLTIMFVAFYERSEGLSADKYL